LGAFELRDVSFALAQGDYFVLLGESGAGKTVILELLCGLTKPDRGRIRLGGADITHVPIQKRDLGLVYQDRALFPHMTVAENLAFPLKVRSMPKSEIETRVKRALDMVKLGHLGGRMPAQLSGGQQQRVAVARALVFEPTLVLMDEPLGALDKNLREQMQYEIKHIHENLGVTVVYVTHDQSEALTMSNRIAVFEDGVMQQLASPADLYERPENAFVAAFIGENNRLPGKIESVNGQDCDVRLDDGSLVRALPVNVSGKGEATTLSLRPERVRINPDGGIDNAFEAKVEELIYLGDHIRTRVNVCGNDEFIIKVPNSDMKGRLAAGETIRVGWSAQDCRALDA